MKRALLLALAVLALAGCGGGGNDDDATADATPTATATVVGDPGLDERRKQRILSVLGRTDIPGVEGVTVNGVNVVVRTSLDAKRANRAAYQSLCDVLVQRFPWIQFGGAADPGGTVRASVNAGECQLLGLDEVEPVD